MQTPGASRPKGRKRLSKSRARKTPDFSNKVAGAQITAAFRKLGAMGVLTGRSARVSARIDRGLLSAAARKVGSDNTTDVVQAALAAFVAPDPFVVWFLSDKDRLPADFELAI
jgi:hypothetical protein